MGIDFNVDIELDEDSFRNTIADVAEEAFIEYVETEAGNGDLECENCSARAFDVETWKNANGGFEGAAVCRECNGRMNLEIDTSDIDALR